MWSAFVVLPLFALANAGISISESALAEAAGSAVALGVAAGLVLGKPLGIASFAWGACTPDSPVSPRASVYAT